MPMPSPVLIRALVVEAKMRPAPPVAMTVALDFTCTTSPVSMSMAMQPTTSPLAFLTRSTAYHSLRKVVLFFRLFW